MYVKCKNNFINNVNNILQFTKVFYCYFLCLRKKICLFANICCSISANSVSLNGQQILNSFVIFQNFFKII